VRAGDRGTQFVSAARSRDRQGVRKILATVELFTIDDVFGGWAKAQKDHFAEGGIFDQIYKN